MAVTYTISVGAKRVRVRQWLESLDAQTRSSEVCQALDAWLAHQSGEPSIATVLEEIRSLKSMVAGARLFVEGSPRPAPEPDTEHEALPGLDVMLDEFS
jgi:hypothetical protein